MFHTTFLFLWPVPLSTVISICLLKNTMNEHFLRCTTESLLCEDVAHKMLSLNLCTEIQKKKYSDTLYSMGSIFFKCIFKIFILRKVCWNWNIFLLNSNVLLVNYHTVGMGNLSTHRVATQTGEWNSLTIFRKFFASHHRDVRHTGGTTKNYNTWKY